MVNDKFEKFESEIMEHIIAEDPAISHILENQYKSAKITNRDFTGRGFFTKFEVCDKSLKLLDNPNCILGITQAKMEGLKYGVGFILFVKDGLISTLECYTYDEPWSGEVTSYIFYK